MPDEVEPPIEAEPATPPVATHSLKDAREAARRRQRRERARAERETLRRQAEARAEAGREAHRAGRKAIRRLERDATRNRDTPLSLLLSAERRHRRRGDLPAAMAAVHEALTLAPDRPDLHVRLGTLHLRDRTAVPGTSAPHAAVASFRQAIALDPRHPNAHHLLADALMALADSQCLGGRDEEADATLQRAIASYRDALATESSDAAEVSRKLADALVLSGRPEQAAACYRRSLAVRPTYEAWCGLGIVTAFLGRPAEAVECYERALAIRTDGKAAKEMTVALLRLGQIERAWEVLESWSSREPSHPDQVPPETPPWRGSNPSAKRILICAAGGIGDEVRLASCYADLIAAAGECHITCEPRLAPLLRRSFPGTPVHPRHRPLSRWLVDREASNPPDFWTALPRFDYYCMAALLPCHFRRSFGAFRRDRAAWLVADPDRRAVWARRLRALGPGLRVGLCWTSGVRSLSRRIEYTSLRDWLPVLRLPGVHFVNLHHGGDDEIRALSAETPIALHQWPDLDLRDDVESVAALVSELDLVISAASFAGDLSGALGVTTWRVIHSHMPSNLWRVFPGTTQDVWCPSMTQVNGEPMDSVPAMIRAVVHGLEARLVAASHPHVMSDESTAPTGTGKEIPRPAEQRAAARRAQRREAKAHDRAERAAERRTRKARERLEQRRQQRRDPANRSRLKTLLLAARAGRKEQNGPAAIAALTEAAALAPDRADLQIRLGRLHLRNTASRRDTRALHAGVECLRRAVALDPIDAETHRLLGGVLTTLAEAQSLAGGDEQADATLAAAIASYREALSLECIDAAETALKLASALFAHGEPAEAAACFQQALELCPSMEAWAGLGRVHAFMGRPADAADCYERAFAIRADGNVAAQLTVTRLQLGQIDTGWDALASWYGAELPDRDCVPAGTPLWRGEALTGKRVLISAGGGIGDEVRFASCYADLIAAAGECHLTCEPRLASIMRRSFPGTPVHPQRRKLSRWLIDHEASNPPDFWSAMPRFDAYCPALLLPCHLRRSFDAFRRDRAAWLVADPERRARWAGRLGALGPGLRVGLCWTSGVRSLDRRIEYTSLRDWLPVLELPGIQFVNLHHGGGDEIRALSSQAPIALHQWPDLDLRNDVENIAALMTELDLVISAASFAGDLSGALGVPTWRVINSHASSNLWRVFPGTKQDVWSPSMTQLNGDPIGDVSALIRAVVGALEELSPRRG